MKTYVKDINFLPQRIILARKKRKRLYVFSVVFLMVTGLIGWVCWFPYQLANSYQQRLTTINTELEQLEPAKPYYQHLVKREDELKVKRDALTEIKQKQTDVLALLSAVNSILPTNCYVSHLDAELSGECTIVVVTHNPAETARVLVGLRSLGLFEGVSLSDVDKVPFTEGAEKVAFKLKFSGASGTDQQQNNQTEQNSNRQQRVNDSQKASETDGAVVKNSGEGTEKVIDIEEDSKTNNNSINNTSNTGTDNVGNNNLIKENPIEQRESDGYEIDFDKDLEQQLRQMEKGLLERELNSATQQ
ncbi:hypothetical protein V6C27_07495 [Peptococcaceae bacterium 1198_IL3148]